MPFSDDTISVFEGEMSRRVVFPDLGVDARGIFDRYSAQFNPAEGTAVVAKKSTLSMSLARVKGVLSGIKGATVKVYDPDGTGDGEAFSTFKCMAPETYENLTVEIGLEA